MGGMLITFFMSIIIKKLGNVITMIVGLSIYMIANYEVTFWTNDISTYHIIFNSLFRGISISFFYVPLANITYTTLPNYLRTDGASLFQLLRTLGTGTSVAIFITLFNRYYKINFDNLRSWFNYSNQGVSDLLNTKELLLENKLYFLKIMELNSSINSLMSDFLVLAICPFLFFPFFVLFRRAN